MQMCTKGEDSFLELWEELIDKCTADKFDIFVVIAQSISF